MNLLGCMSFSENACVFHFKRAEKAEALPLKKMECRNVERKEQCIILEKQDHRQIILTTEEAMEERMEEESFYCLKELFPCYAYYLQSYFRAGKASELLDSKILESLLKAAVERKASDLHFEVFENRGRIRLRCNGSLQSVLEIEKEFYPSLILQVKMKANLDIVEKRLPQEGRFSAVFEEEVYDFRVSILPTIFGEKAVLRILDRKQVYFDLTSLGFARQDLVKIKEVLRKKSGLILNCGPTGAGKSSTLYSFLNYKKEEDINIISVEDPVEYHLDGVTQVSCHEEIGLDYPLILKTLLRQDPDCIMIGEIRDKKTAEIAIKAALTGHLVISTIHAKNTIQCLERLENLGVDPTLIAHSLLMILSQRLLKKLCPHCKKRVLEEGREEYRASACPDCRYSGYSGRIAIFELFFCEGENRKAILKWELSEEKLDYHSLEEDALEKWKQGFVTKEEAMQII